MHSVDRVIACLPLLLGIVYAQPEQPTAAQLEAFERFASKPTAKITWSKEVGRIDTDQAHAVITAIVVEDATQTPGKMRGVRIDLSDGDLKDRLYTSEEYLDRLISALDEISMGAPFFLARVRSSNSCHGSGTFWLQPGHAFNASQCVFGNWSGLSVNNSFRFTGLDPSPFASAIARGRDEVKRR